MSDRGTFSGRPGRATEAPSGVPSLPPGLLSPSGLVGPAVTEVPAPDAPSPGSPVLSQDALGAAFAGRPATAGARLAAFSIDVVAVAIITAIVGLTTASIPLGIVTALELALALWVLESRTGLTLGNALLRLRSSREDAPFSPGVGQGFVRWFLTGAGFVVGIAGAWLVVASSAWDRSGRSRSWADRAAGTVVVAVPPRVRSEDATPGDGVRFAAPHIVSNTMRIAADDDAVSVLAPSPVLSEATGDGTTPAGSAPALTRDSGSIAVAYPPQAQEGVEAGALLLIFDTGQREQLPTPVAVNLGRNPSETQPGDRLISVNDPDSTVSRTHLRLEHSRGRTWVTDNASTNGTEIRSDDGQSAPLQPGNRLLLDEGDRVRIGNRTFTISVMLPHEVGAQGGAR